MKVLLLDPGRPETLHPLTIERELLDLPVAGTRLRTVLLHRLRQEGLEPTDEAKASTLTLPGDSWISRESLTTLRAHRGPCRLMTQTQEALAWVGSASGSEPVPVIGALPGDRRIEYPWDLLEINEELVGGIKDDRILGRIHEGAHVTGHLHLGSGSEVLPGVFIEGNVVIGEDCRVGPNCYIRGATAIGDHSRIGQAVEIKNSIIGSRTHISHLSYCGDSVIGDSVNFGAGTVVANLRHDGRNHRSMVAGELVDTGRRKFGTVIADGVHTGIHTSIYPGRKLWPNASTRPGEIVDRDRHE
jgi:UDP-N-acetylglucosamine diphosphorylase / glucose-1-phosphate thymidylyltransferase / UDP-N-acetylgalactosamine diphosphorylase / glucosamine-1-phosphate N-acetyltransferase / galactosamine-1-phosphate N-acetyltransferase